MANPPKLKFNDPQLIKIPVREIVVDGSWGPRNVNSHRLQLIHANDGIHLVVNDIEQPMKWRVIEHWRHQSTWRAETRFEEEKMATSSRNPASGVKDTACVDVCPVDCIYGKNEDSGDALHPSRGVHRLRPLRRRLPGRGDLSAGRGPRQVEECTSTRTRGSSRSKGSTHRHRAAGEYGGDSRRRPPVPCGGTRSAIRECRDSPAPAVEPLTPALRRRLHPRAVLL